MNTIITLTKPEELLIDILLKALEYAKRNTILRIAGGWVRDKVHYYCTRNCLIDI